MADRSSSASYKSFRSNMIVKIISHVRRPTVVINFVHYVCCTCEIQTWSSLQYSIGDVILR